MRAARTMFVGSCVLAIAGAAHAQLRIAEWNVTAYGSGRVAPFSTSFYGEFNGRSMSPDVVIVQEISESESGGGATSVANFLSILNNAAGSPGDWSAAPYVPNGGSGPNPGNALFFRASRLVWISTTTLSADTGTGPDQAPRTNQRWLVRLAGSSGAGSQMYIYSSHMKAGSTGEDEDRRTPEGRRIRNDANNLPTGTNFLLGGDFNIQSSSQLAYELLVLFNANPPAGSEVIADASGRFFDPINTPGNWNNSGSFRFVHSQEPTSAMDDRHDQILISSSLRDGQGLDYIGNTLIPYSTSTWDDPNHSFRAWGNDGGSFNLPIRTTQNTMVGPVIAQALIDSVVPAGVGHLPVYLDLQVPASVGSSVASVDFGTVNLVAVAQAPITIRNDANLALWSKNGTGFGIDELTYAMAASAGFSVPGTVFEDPADPAMQGNQHQITMDTSSLGPKVGTLTIASDDPDVPSLVINLVGNVASPFDYDVNNDSSVSIEDLYAWQAMPTDVDGNGSINIADRAALLYELRRLETADVTSGRR